MKRLNECPQSSTQAHRRWCASVVDDRTGMSVDVLSDDPCVAFALDGEQWGSPTNRPDGALVFEHGAAGGVAFIELKGTVDPENPERPFTQIRAGVEHFSNVEVHGGQHHEQWASGEDLPLAAVGRRGAPLCMGKEHVTFGVIVVSRGGTRIRPQTFECSGHRRMVIVVQKHGSRGGRSIELAELLEQVGVDAPPAA
jgi:hypothetical protein